MKKAIRISKQYIQSLYRPIDELAHKGTQGHVVIVGGSYGKIGAVCLSSKASLKAGCGLVTVYLPKCGYEIVQISNPEVMAITDAKRNFISSIELEFEAQAIGIGPGLGQERATKKALYQFLRLNNSPLVVDADALNILAQHKDWLSLVKPGTVFTPHPKELERLIGSWESESQRNKMAMEFAARYDSVLVMKGAPTYITDGLDFYENTTGNAALATAGSGDVLTGIITSLIAQSYSPLEAAQLAVYLHGLTADLAVKEMGHQAFIASDIIGYLGKAYLAIEAGNAKH